MAQTTYTFQATRSTITAPGLNSLYENVEQNTNGIVGKIDESNTRTEAFNRNHFKTGSSPNKADDYYDGTSVEWGFDPALTGVFTTIWTWNKAITVRANEALRIEWNPLIELSFHRNMPSALVRAKSAFYIRLFVTIGGVDTPVTAPFGYNTIVAGDGNTGTSDNKTLFYERIPLSAMFMPTSNSSITAIKAKIYFDDGDSYKYEISSKYGIAVHHEF